MAKGSRFSIRLWRVVAILGSLGSCLGALGTWMNVPEGRSVLHRLMANFDVVNEIRSVPDDATFLPDYDPYNPTHEEWWATTLGGEVFGSQLFFRLLPGGKLERRIGPTGQPLTNLEEDSWSRSGNQLLLNVRLERTIIICLGTVGSKQNGITGECRDVQTPQARISWKFNKV